MPGKTQRKPSPSENETGVAVIRKQHPMRGNQEDGKSGRTEILYQTGHAVAYLVAALCNKTEGRGFECRRGHWILQLTLSFRS
jgi:hypothetical protein